MKSTIIIIILIFSSNTYSQTLNLQSSPKNKIQLGLSFDKAIFSNTNVNLSALTGIFNFDLNIPVSQKLNIIGKIPILNYQSDISDPYIADGVTAHDVSETNFGNLFIGLQTNHKSVEYRRSIYTFGVFLPTAQSEALYGLFYNFYDLQFYFTDAIGLYFNYMYEKNSEEGFNYSLEIGPDIAIPTHKTGADTEIFIHYGLNLSYQIYKIRVNAEILGYGIVTQEVDDFTDRFTNLINVGLQWKESNIIPKIFYRVYLREDMKESIDGIWGVGVNVLI